MKFDALAKALAGDVASVLRKHLAAHKDAIHLKLAEIETAIENRFAALPAPEKGEKGDPGTVDMDAVKQIITEEVAHIEPLKGEPGEKGDKGEDGVVDMPTLMADISAAIAAIEPRVGEKGDRGDKGDTPEIPMDSIKEIIAEEVARIEIPAPIPGEPGPAGVVDMNEVKRLIAQEVAAIEVPAGKSALDIEIEDGIAEDKAYPRGTYARHKGGLWRSFKRTNGMNGWECIVAGIADIAVEYDGERSVSIKIAKSDGEEEIKTVTIPTMIDKGVYRPGDDYAKGDTVTFSGAIWVAQKDEPAGRPGSPGIPGGPNDWRLAVKRGGTGKSAFDLAREAGFEGDRQQWLDQIGKKPTVKV